MTKKCYNVIADGGAKGDGVTDDTAAIQTAINQTPFGGDLCFPAPQKFYKISKTLSVPQSIFLRGKKSAIVQTVPGQGGFAVAGSVVSIRGLILQGPQFTTQTFAEQAISAVGANAQSPLFCIDVCENIISGWGMYGIYAQYVNMFGFDDNDISNVNYAGIIGLSIATGCIDDNEVSNVVATPNAYGISITRTERAVNELISDPLSKNIVVARNKVSNVNSWEGISTHGGQAIRFVGNDIQNCNRGINVGPCNNAKGISTYAPKNCVVIDNAMDSGVTDGSAVYGITVSGASAVLGTLVDGAENCKVWNNEICNYGNQAANLGMAMYLVSTKNVSVRKNNFFQPSPVGVGLYYNNFGFEVVENKFIDPWSLVQGGVCGVKVMSDYNVGHVDLNRYLRGTKAATNVLLYGLFVNDFPHNKVFLGKDYSEAGTAVYDPGKHIV
jgi:hypothetical protein